MNPCLILTRNCLALTKRCVESVRRQDIPVSIHIIDNGSSDGTVPWAYEEGILLDAAPENAGVSAGWNRGLSYVFNNLGKQHCLVVGNDTVLAPWTFSLLLSYQKGFVTGVAVDSMMQIAAPSTQRGTEPHPDFSCFVITVDTWLKIGQFDERMKHYCSDCDYHLRGFRLGVGLYKACVEFYHERSSTLRLAPPGEQAEIQEQANKDREVFQSIYGCLPGSSEYEDLFRS